MIRSLSIALALGVLVTASGCARSAKVASVHVEQPGTHVISGQGAVSIAQNDGRSTRVCTRLVAPPSKGGRGKPGPAVRPEPAAHLDVLLFRLCEARGNGDISAEQYAAAVQTILKAMESMAARPRIQAPPAMRRAWRRRGLGPPAPREPEPVDPDAPDPAKR
jgi:hypothetical protein